LVVMVPSPSLSKREKASLNSAICSSVNWSAMLLVCTSILIRLTVFGNSVVTDTPLEMEVVKIDQESSHRRVVGFHLVIFFLVLDEISLFTIIIIIIIIIISLLQKASDPSL
jgi:hypothetical protein